MSTSTSPTPPPPPSHPAPPTGAGGAGAAIDLNSTDIGCIRCGYNLRGLSPEGACPECGAPIAQSLKGDLLEFSSPEYLASLHRGVVVVLITIVVQILLGFGMFAAGLVGAGLAVMTLLNLAATGVAIALVVGWWWFSAPDPAMLGADKGDRPRQIVRITLIASVFVTLVSTVTDLSASSMTAAGFSMMEMVVGVAGLVAMIVGYFAQMLYVRWLARRLPNEKVVKRASTLLWLGPVLYTFGLLLIGLGPLIALILYWFMLEWVRKDLKAIRARQEV